MTSTKPIVLIGGAGKTGARVLERLQRRDLPVRPASRRSQPAFDWTDPATYAPALRGARAAYVAFYPDLALPGAADAIGALAAVARTEGLERLVLLSGRGEPGAQEAEQALMAAGVPSTVVRCSWFMQNFSESYLLDPVLAGEVALPVDGVPEPFVDLDDVADVAVAALTEDGHAGAVYELTGPSAITFAEATAAIGRATGRPVRFAPVPMDAYLAVLAEHGVPDDVAGLLRHLFAEVLDGRNAVPADGVRRALGREPRAFSDWAEATATTGVWG
jgi:uncharacterized protein YbjT (DUF2867 family)